MKGLFYLVILAVVCTACSDSDDDSGRLNLSKVSVKDATLIYKRRGTSRSEEGETSYWKMDRQGNETRVVCYDEEGQETNVRIDKIEKMSENLLLIATELGPVLADVRTEKLYQAPGEWADGDVPSLVEAGDGMLYYLDWGWTVKQLNPQNFTYKSYLPEGQEAQVFLVSRKGSCWYGQDIKSNGKIMAKGGRIYPVEGQVFLSEKDGMLYSLNDNKIIRWKETSDNEIIQEEVCEMPMRRYYSDDPYFLFINDANKNVVISYCGFKGEFDPDGIGISYECFAEFDGTSVVQKKGTPFVNEDKRFAWDEFRFQFFLNDGYTITDLRQRKFYQWQKLSTGQILFGNNGRSYSLNLSTYELTEKDYEIPASEYEVYTRQQGFDSMLFSALRYLDGKIVIGKVDKNGQVEIISVQESSDKVTQLIPLN